MKSKRKEKKRPEISYHHMYEYFKEHNPDIKMSKKEYKQLLDIINFEVMGLVIEGKPIQMPCGMGTISVMRIERNYKNKQVDWGATQKDPENQEKKKRGEKMKRIYFTDPWYLRFVWSWFRKKQHWIRNGRVYKFQPTDYKKRPYQKIPDGIELGAKQRLKRYVDRDESYYQKYPLVLHK